MKEYLKMGDAFSGKAINSNGEVVVNKYKDVDYGEYVCHAINSHDELVAEIERLRDAMSGLLSLAEHFAEVGGLDANAYSEYEKAKGA